jgi:beta-phosphoglucomutase
VDALIFDFDGVVVDSEPIHLAAFQRILPAVGVEMTREAYFAKYLGYDDRDAIAACARDQGVELAAHRITQLIEAKTAVVKRLFGEGLEPLPGAVELIRAATEAGTPVAVCSGALREEIELASRAVGVWECFSVVVAAEDVARGKPDPSGYALTLERLSEALGRPVEPGRCVVVEDSPAGIAAAKAVGLKVLAVTNSYPASDLAAADRVVDSLAGVELGQVEALASGGAGRG